MNFAFPWVLLLLPVALLLLRKRKWNAVSVSSLAGWRSAERTHRMRWLKALNGLRALVLVLLVVAMAGPRMERDVSEEVRQGVAIEMLLDASSSMDQNVDGGAEENVIRLEAAKTAVETFVENRPDDLIGLITFARYADTICPLTFGHEALVQLVSNVEIQDRPNEDGTAYGDALSLACAHLDRMDQWHDDDKQIIQSKAVVLLTDGENNCGRHLPREAAGLAKRWGIRIYTISLGASYEDEPTHAEKLLEMIGEATGGGFWKIVDVEGLEKTYDRIDKLETSEIKSATLVHTEYTSIFGYFALPAFLLLIFECILKTTVLRVTEESAA